MTWRFSWLYFLRWWTACVQIVVGRCIDSETRDVAVG